VECAILFHTRVEKFVQKLLLSSQHLLGTIKEYVICYKIQQLGSLHAHIILWVVKNDIENITNEIFAFIPATFDEKKKEFIQPSDGMQNSLYKIVMKKQLHTCGNRCILNESRNQCKHGFPFNAQLYQQFKFNNYTNHWEYHCPKYEDHNVVPYHASLLLLWGAHLYIQRTTPSYWSYYLLKYVMKCEPYGALNLNHKNAEHLSLQNVSQVQLQFISSLKINKLVSRTEVALTCL